MASDHKKPKGFTLNSLHQDEETISQLRAEVERLKAEIDDIKQVQFPAKLQAVISGRKEQQAAQQAHIELLRDTLKKVLLKVSRGFVTQEWAFVQKALDIPSSQEAIREHDAAFIEVLAQRCESNGWYVFGDRIRRLGK